MNVEALKDTILNVTVFAYIGFLIRLFLRNEDKGGDDDNS